MEKLLYRVTETAQLLGLSRSKVYVLIQAGVLPSVRIDGSRRRSEHQVGVEELQRDCSSSASRVTICPMSSLTIRTDPEVERALGALTRDGLSRSEAARTAILEAERANRRARIRAEAESLRNDPEDVAASRELAAEMDAIRAW